MTPEVVASLERYIQAMADDELVIGYRDTEWTGAAPLVEEDVAMSSIGQDEVAHARLYYRLLHDLTGSAVDHRARRPEEYLHADLLSRGTAPLYDPGGIHGGGDWALHIVRRYFYDLFEAERLAAIRTCAWEPLAAAVEKVEREERYHLGHGRLWFDRLARGDLESRRRFVEALDRLWPEALGFFEPIEGEEALRAQGMITATSDELRDRWLDRLFPAFVNSSIPMPARRSPEGTWEVGVEPSFGGRRGEHGIDWLELWDEMTSVYRLDPTATW